MTPTAVGRPFGLRLIGGFKLLTAILLVGLGLGLFHHVGKSPEEQAEHLVADLKLDPGNHYVHSAIARISGISPGQLRAIRVGTFLYALLYLVEGTGLLMRKHWAEYFTVIATGSLIPLEIYEVFHRHTPVRVGILAINLAIVAYLIVQLVRRPAEAAPAPADAGSPVT